MSEDQRPIVVAYDGSREAHAALEAATGLFRDRTLLVVSVWEAGMALATAPPDLNFGAAPSFEYMEAIDRTQHERAVDTATEGVDTAQRLGARAEAVPIQDTKDISGTIRRVAQERDAAAIVIGSRGHKGLTRRLFGSTSHDLLQHETGRPVMVLRCPPDDD